MLKQLGTKSTLLVPPGGTALLVEAILASRSATIRMKLVMMVLPAYVTLARGGQVTTPGQLVESCPPQSCAISSQCGS